MLFSDICDNCVGLDISPENIAVFNEKLADKMSESRSCVGLSNHALLSCRKV